jgi:4-hydroxy-tetrahydrodipicolinate synthase
MDLEFGGVNPANVVPMTDDGGAIDEAGLKRHLRTLVGTDGVDGIVTNGHAGELYALTDEERARVVELAASVADDDTPVVSGVVGGSTRAVVEGVERVRAAGADGVLVVPPHTPIHNRPAAARGFFEDVASESDLPLVVFQHPHWAGGHYPPDLLAEVAAVDGVVAVKDAVWDVDHFQRDLRALRDGAADVDLYVANDEHLLASFALGADGAILELAAVVPEPIVELYEAVEAGDIERARAVSERLEPFVDAMYEPPVTDSHTRLKVALELRGTIDSAAPRPPAAPIPDEEVASIERAMAASEVR